jgi:hypothetical protein
MVSLLQGGKYRFDAQQILGAEPVHTGKNVEDYVGGVFRDVDEKDP